MTERFYSDELSLVTHYFHISISKHFGTRLLPYKLFRSSPWLSHHRTRIIQIYLHTYQSIINKYESDYNLKPQKSTAINLESPCHLLDFTDIAEWVISIFFFAYLLNNKNNKYSKIWFGLYDEMYKIKWMIVLYLNELKDDAIKFNFCTFKTMTWRVCSLFFNCPLTCWAYEIATTMRLHIWFFSSLSCFITINCIFVHRDAAAFALRCIKL